MNEISNLSNLIFPLFPNAGQGVTPSSPALVKPFGVGTGSRGEPDPPAMRRAVSRAVELSSFSIARARAVRSEIDHGTYETSARVDGTVERLLDVIA